MAGKGAKAFLRDLNEKTELLEYLKGYKSQEGKSKEDNLLDVAVHFGYEFTKEELIAEIKTIEGATAAAETAVKEMSSEEMDAVAGGITYKPEDIVECVDTGACMGVPVIRQKNCKDTFIQRENCWFNDACDHTFHIYKNNYCGSTRKFM